METERNKELNDAPRLRGMKGEIPFTVPDGYFISLSTRIQDKINVPKQKPVLAKLFEPLQHPVFAYAAITCVLLICAGVYFYEKQNPVVLKQTAEVNISADDLYNSEMFNDYDEATLVELLASNSITTPKATVIEDYLIDSNTDETEIINAL